MLIWSSIFSAVTSTNLCFRVSIQNLCIFLVSSNFQFFSIATARIRFETEYNSVDAYILHG